MAFSRRVEPPPPPQDGATLTASLIGIGFGLAGESDLEPNIEDALLWASLEGLEGDFRVLAILVTWFGIHSPYVNADRLTFIVKAQKNERLRAFWSAVARWRRKDSRFRRLGRIFRGSRVDVLPAGTAFHIRRHGEDERFDGTPLRVPANFLRDRTSDVLSPPELARRHRVYRARVQMGPTFRADMWAELERDASLSAAELARRTYGSFSTAWHVRRDFSIVERGISSLVGL